MIRPVPLALRLAASSAGSKIFTQRTDPQLYPAVGCVPSVPLLSLGMSPGVFATQQVFAPTESGAYFPASVSTCLIWLRVHFFPRAAASTPNEVASSM